MWKFWDTTGKQWLKKSKANMSNEPKIKQNLRKNEKVQTNKWGKEGGETIGSNIVHQNATSRRFGRRHCQGRAWDAETGTRKREKERPWPVSGVRKVRCQTFHISLKSFSPFFRALKLTYYPRQTKRSLFPEVKRLQANFFFLSEIGRSNTLKGMVHNNQRYDKAWVVRIILHFLPSDTSMFACISSVT